MRIKLIILSVLLAASGYSQVKTFSAIKVIDSLSIGGSQFIDTVIDISTYNGNLQVDTITANLLLLPNDTITGLNNSISITQLNNLSNTWERNGSNMYPVGYTKVGIGTETPIDIFQVEGRIVFNNNYAGTSIGYNAGNPTNYRNTFIGYNAGHNIDYADNTALGAMALYSSVHVRDNIAVGSSAGYNNTGDANILIGYKSGYNNAGNNLTAVGYKSGYNNTKSNNTFIGFEAGKENTTADYNTFVGNSSGHTITTGSFNTAIGALSLSNSITSSSNTSIGFASGAYLIDGTYNTFIGLNAGRTNIHGTCNTFIGTNSGYSSTGDSSIYIGNYAGYNETGSNKLYIANSNTTTPLIYGEFDNNYLRLNADSLDYTNAVAQYHRLDSFIITTADTWQNIKLDTNIASESTYGFEFNSDSTGIIINTKGIFRVQGCVHWHYNGSDLTKVNLYLRVLIDGIEARCLQANSFKDRKANDYGSQAFTGTVFANYNEVIQLQVRVSDTDMVLKGDNIFDNPVATSINFEKITFK